MSNQNPHQGQSVATAGVLLANAEEAMVIMHGRGGTNHQALALSDYLNVPGFAFLAPQAANHSWYPHRFIAPRKSNEPYLSSALNALHDVIKHIEAQGIPTSKIMLLGFSQGACLCGEYAARHPKRYGGVMILSGGLIGTDDELTGYKGSLDNTPIFLGCSDVDEHIPEKRVHQSAEILKKLDGNVETRIYPGMGHTINNEELNVVKSIMEQVVATEL
ncbi:MAG: phospholipase [Chloroflexi bacterium]|nr:MAG: phospholipase [Chloroflexota bacterium]